MLPQAGEALLAAVHAVLGRGGGGGGGGAAAAAAAEPAAQPAGAVQGAAGTEAAGEEAEQGEPQPKKKKRKPKQADAAEEGEQQQQGRQGQQRGSEGATAGTVKGGEAVPKAGLRAVSGKSGDALDDDFAEAVAAQVGACVLAAASSKTCVCSPDLLAPGQHQQMGLLARSGREPPIPGASMCLLPRG